MIARHRTNSKHARLANRGLTLIELMLALAVTTMVAGAMSGMVAAVSTGVMDRQDTRTLMIRASGADSKLAAYIGPARAIWSVSSDTVALWLNDNRPGGTIHATEVRWFVFDADAGTLEVHYVKFPSDWTQTACDLSDVEYPKSASSATMYTKYRQAGYMASLRLLDGVEGFAVTTNENAALDSTRINFQLSFTGSDGPFVTTIPVAISHHQAPVR